MNPVVHFEMPAENGKRMSKFYETAFGWKTKETGPEMSNYIVVTTTESDEKGPKKPGAINGGFYMKTDDKMSHAPSVVISVDSLEDSMKKIEQAGGKLIDKPVDIPGVGKYISFVDTEGNRVSILQPMMPR